MNLMSIFITIIIIFCVLGLGLAGGYYVYHQLIVKNYNKNNMKKNVRNQKKGRKIPAGLRNSDISEGIKQTKISITSTKSMLNKEKVKK